MDAAARMTREQLHEEMRIVSQYLKQLNASSQGFRARHEHKCLSRCWQSIDATLALIGARNADEQEKSK